MTECNTGFHARYQGSGCIGAGPSDTWIRTLECVCGVGGGGGGGEDFPGGPVAKTLCSQCRGTRFDPWSGN